MMVQDAEGSPNVVEPPKRRRKKTEVPVVDDPETRVVALSSTSTKASSKLTDNPDAVSSPKPKRTRRVGEPKPKRYAVGESSTETTQEKQQDLNGERA